MRTTIAALMFCATALTACGNEPSGTASAPASPVGPATSATTPPARATGEAEPAAASTWPPARGPIPLDLPLDQDLEWYPGDGGERLGPAPGAPGIDGADVCGTPLWPPPVLPGVTGRLAVTGTGPEHGDVRELVTFIDEVQALAAFEHVRAVVQACPAQETSDGGTVTWHVLDDGPVSATYASSISPGIGGTAVQATVVGSAVLLVQSHGEFGPDSHLHVLRELSGRTRDIAPMLCFATEAC
jgi:hypothetical protein